MWGWGCYKDKEGKKWFNPNPDGKLFLLHGLFIINNAFSQCCEWSCFGSFLIAANPVKDIKKQQDVAIRLKGLANVVEVACGSSFNLVSCALLRIQFNLFRISSHEEFCVVSNNHYNFFPQIFIRSNFDFPSCVSFLGQMLRRCSVLLGPWYVLLNLYPVVMLLYPIIVSLSFCR